MVLKFGAFIAVSFCFLIIGGCNSDNKVKVQTVPVIEAPPSYELTEQVQPQNSGVLIELASSGSYDLEAQTSIQILESSSSQYNLVSTQLTLSN